VFRWDIRKRNFQVKKPKISGLREKVKKKKKKTE